MNKVDPCLFMSKTVICVLYVDDCIFWARSQSDIDNVMESFKEDGTSYNWEHSKGESVSEFLGIDIKTLDDGGFQFCQIGLIQKFLESTGMEHYNGLPTPTKVESPLGTDPNDSKAKQYWPNSYASVIGMMLYLASNTRPLSFVPWRYRHILFTAVSCDTLALIVNRHTGGIYLVLCLMLNTTSFL